MVAPECFALFDAELEPVSTEFIKARFYIFEHENKIGFMKVFLLRARNPSIQQFDLFRVTRVPEVRRVIEILKCYACRFDGPQAGKMQEIFKCLNVAGRLLPSEGMLFLNRKNNIVSNLPFAVASRGPG